MVIEVNKDIDRYQESVAMGLTARQLIFSIASVVVGGGIVLLLYKYIGLTGSAYVAIPCVAPIALGGFYSFNGMNFYEYMGKKLHFMFGNRTLITAEFREELYTNILDAYARIKEPEKEETQKQERTQEMPEFSVTVTPYEREGSNIKGLARIYFENSFIVNNINIVQGKEKIFVSMPSYKTKQVDEQGKPIYQDVCYPVTKDFREKLYNEIISEYEKAKDKSNENARESAEKHHGNPDKEKDKEATPFR